MAGYPPRRSRQCRELRSGLAMGTKQFIKLRVHRLRVAMAGEVDE